MSFTPLEQFRLNGSIDNLVLENLLESNHYLQIEVEEIGRDILGDAKCGAVAEDCLQNQIDALQDVISRMGTSKFKKELQEIVENLNDKQTELAGGSEYAMEELDKVNERWMNIYSRF